MKNGARILVVNADDFGQSPGVNRGIIQAHENGIVTSASLMVRWPSAASAARYARRSPRLSLGLHLDLCEWSLRNDAWQPIYEVVPLADPQGVKQEILRQVAAFEALAGAPPTHIDSHQHFHMRDPARAVTAEIAASLNVPLRACDPRLMYCGRFYGQSAGGRALPDLIGVEALVRIIEELPEGATELGCHPGLDADLDTMYSREREREVETLCHPAVRAALVREGIELRSFAELPEAAWPG